MAALLALAAGIACPLGSLAREPGWTASLLFENDLFADRDEEYTNGIQLGLVSPDLERYRDSRWMPRWLLPAVRRLPLVNAPGRQRNLGFVVGQKIFTPRDTQRPTLVADDRPYAGWLYAGIVLHAKTERRLDTIEVDVGVVGPWSLAEQAQRLVHRLRDLRIPQGWAHQLHNEPGLVVAWQQRRRVWRRRLLGHLEADALGRGGVVFGNVATHVGAGAELRLGWNLPRDFGTALIRPGGDVNAPVTVGGAETGGLLSVHGFAAAGGRVVARDIFLDGNTFRSSHRVDRRNLVGELVVGAGLTWRGLKLTYAQVFVSEEFEGQRGGHEYGSVSLSYTF